jgi:hypothetical protein
VKTKLVILFGLLLAFPLSLAVSKSGSAKAIQALSAGTTTRVSVSSTGGQSNGSSEYSVISADGRYIAYYSFAGNLVQDDTNSASDVFVYDRLAKTTERVSIGSNGQQGNQDSGRFGVDISADGRYVAFGANASNLVDDDTNGVPDTFIHDRLTHQTSRVSVSSNGIQGNATSYSLAISANGRYVAFSSSSLSEKGLHLELIGIE